MQLYALDAEAVKAVLHRQAAALVSPLTPPHKIVTALQHDAPGFAELLARALRS